MREFSVGNLLKGSFQVIRHNGLRLGVVVVVFASALSVLFREMEASVLTETDVLIAAMYGLTLSADTIFSGLITPLVVLGAVRTLRYEDWTFAEAFRLTGAVALPVILLSLLVLFAVLAGLALLIVPGLILMTRWAVAASARVMEPVSISGALTRSASLTKGHRWGLFGGLLIFIVIGLLIMTVFEALAAAMLSMTMASDPGFGLSIAASALSGFGQGLAAFLFMVAPPVAYTLLRTEKEGGGAQSIAQVFD